MDQTDKIWKDFYDVTALEKKQPHEKTLSEISTDLCIGREAAETFVANQIRIGRMGTRQARNYTGRIVKVYWIISSEPNDKSKSNLD